ncbi:hypothetical protein CCR96_17420 [Halochromatium roseum]|nr:hypothetical protein [Halochromatium roseum]
MVNGLLYALTEAIACQGQTLRRAPPSPSSADAAFAAGRAACRQGDHQAAITHFRETLRHAPEHLPAHNNFAMALQAVGEIDETLRIAQQAVVLAPDKAVLHSNLGALWQLQGDHDQAIAAYEQALALQPDLFLAHDNLAKALAAQGHFHRAEAAYQEARRLRVCLEKIQTQFASVFFSMAMRIMFSAVAVSISTSLLRRRNRPSQAKVLSTTQRLGSTAHWSLIFWEMCSSSPRVSSTYFTAVPR